MKLSIALSANGVYVVDYDGCLIITLQPVEKRALKKSLNLTFYDVPFIRLDLKFVWDKGYPEEKVVPTVSWLSVPKKLRGTGLGVKLVHALLEVMRERNVKHVMFEDYSDGFWHDLRDPHVTFPRKLRGRIGHIDL